MIISWKNIDADHPDQQQHYIVITEIDISPGSEKERKTLRVLNGGSAEQWSGSSWGIKDIEWNLKQTNSQIVNKTFLTLSGKKKIRIWPVCILGERKYLFCFIILCWVCRAIQQTELTMRTQLISHIWTTLTQIGWNVSFIFIFLQ